MEVLDPLEASAAWAQDSDNSAGDDPLQTPGEKPEGNETTPVVAAVTPLPKGSICVVLTNPVRPVETVKSQMKSSILNFPCDLCKGGFQSKQRMLEHLYLGHFFGMDKVESLYQGPENSCKVCKATLDESLPSHVAKHHILWTRCPVCQSDFQNSALMIPHLLSHLGLKIQIDKQTSHCPKCQKSFAYKLGMVGHLQWEHFFDQSEAVRRYQGKSPEWCKVCDTSSTSLLNHIRYKHPDPTCPVCDKKFDLMSSMQLHLLDSHTDFGKDETKTTNFLELPSTSSEAAATETAVPKTPQKGSRCPQCKKYYVKHDDMLYHLYRIHFLGKNVKNYRWKQTKCSTCNCSFRDLEYHNYSEHVEPVCPVCQKKLTKFPEMLAHLHSEHRDIRLHVKEPVVKLPASALVPGAHKVIARTCPLCRNKYSTPAAMLGHLYYHHFVEPNMERVPSFENKKCSLCKEKIRSMKHRMLHIVRHANLDPLECPVCHQMFMVVANMQAHLFFNHVANDGEASKDEAIVEQPEEQK